MSGRRLRRRSVIGRGGGTYDMFAKDYHINATVLGSALSGVHCWRRDDIRRIRPPQARGREAGSAE